MSGHTFEVSWDEPWEERMPWRHERWHTPGLVSPLGADVTERLIYGGFRQGAANDATPYRMTAKRINGYVYLGIREPFEDEREVTEQLPPPTERLDYWDRVWLPEVQAILDRLAGFDHRGATDEALAQHFDELTALVIRAWAIHGALEFSLSEFIAFCGEHLEYDSAASTRMLQGQPSKSLEADDALRAVAALAAASPAVQAALEATDPLPALRDTPDAATFLVALEGHLAAWGLRSDNFMEMAFPSWTEDPTPVLAMIRMYVAVPRDVEADRRRLVAEREAAIAEARDRLEGPTRDQFDELLARAQRGARLNEDHNYWIDQQTMHWTRQTLIEIGRRLAARGAVEAPNDVAMLLIDEAIDALRSPDRDMQTLVRERQAEMARWADPDPPPALGTPMPISDQMESVFGFGDATRAANEVARTVIRGQAASPGTHRGVARVISTIAEGDRIRAGDVLVTATTSPPWTPLFGAASAIVTDAGGSLSHAAIVAREYGIPAVVGTSNATALIPDGATIEVDGSAGEVRIVSPDAAG